MSIQDIAKKLKGFLDSDDIFMVLLIILVSVASFGLGRASVEGTEGTSVEYVESNGA